MQKEFYKLILVFIMIMLAFYLAFFLGRELTLFEQENQKTRNSKSAEKAFDTSSDPPSPSKPFDNQTIENKDQRQKVQEYKKLLPPSSDEQVSQVKPSEATSPALSSSESVSTRKKPEIYGLLVAKYKDRDAAIDKSSHLKVRFPTWDIFFKLSDDVYKVYIGPFRGEKSAENFLKNLDKKKEFKEVRLEKITSSDTDKSNE